MRLKWALFLVLVLLLVVTTLATVIPDARIPELQPPIQHSTSSQVVYSPLSNPDNPIIRVIPTPAPRTELGPNKLIIYPSVSKISINVVERAITYNYTVEGTGFKPDLKLSLAPIKNPILSIPLLSNYICPSGAYAMGSVKVPKTAPLGLYKLVGTQGKKKIQTSNLTVTVYPTGTPLIYKIYPEGMKRGIQTQLFINGVNFKLNNQTPSPSRLMFKPYSINGTSLTGGILSISNTLIVGDLKIPDNATSGLYNVAAVLGNRTTNSNTQFYIADKEPVINSVAPSTILRNVTTTLTINGANFNQKIPTTVKITISSGGTTYLVDSANLKIPSSERLSCQINWPVSLPTGTGSLVVDQMGVRSNSYSMTIK